MPCIQGEKERSSQPFVVVYEISEAVDTLTADPKAGARWRSGGRPATLHCVSPFRSHAGLAV